MAGMTERTHDVSGYAVIIEQGEVGYGAYAPELPGVGVAGDSVEEVERLIREAVALHLQSLRAHGVPGATTVGGRRHRRHGARGLILRADLP